METRQKRLVVHYRVYDPPMDLDFEVMPLVMGLHNRVLDHIPSWTLLLYFETREERVYDAIRSVGMSEGCLGRSRSGAVRVGCRPDLRVTVSRFMSGMSLVLPSYLLNEWCHR